MRETDEIVKSDETGWDGVVDSLWVDIHVLDSLQSLMIVSKEDMSAKKTEQCEITELEVEIRLSERVSDRVRIALLLE